MGAGLVTLVDALPERAAALAARLNALFPGRVQSALAECEVRARADGLVHPTPTGMASHPGAPLDLHLLRPEVWVAEIVYFPLETELLRAARAAGCKTIDGSGMALLQAAEAFRLFTGVEPDLEAMPRAFATP